MPVSESANLHPIIAELERLQPEGIIDLGCGTGLYGCAARNYLDGRWGRLKHTDWKVVISGIEGFAEYENPLWGAYDHVMIKDFRQCYESVVDWPMVLMIDSLEHVDMLEAKMILEHLVRNNKHVIVSVPLGNCPQGTCFGNELETHRSTWIGVQDFSNYNYRVLHKEVCLVISLSGVKQ
jgi:hypothetical protein